MGSPIDELLRLAELEVHVGVNGEEGPLVLHSPLELADHRLANQVVKKRLGINGLRLRKDEEKK